MDHWYHESHIIGTIGVMNHKSLEPLAWWTIGITNDWHDESWGPLASWIIKDGQTRSCPVVLFSKNRYIVSLSTSGQKNYWPKFGRQLLYNPRLQGHSHCLDWKKVLYMWPQCCTIVNPNLGLATIPIFMYMMIDVLDNAPVLWYERVVIHRYPIYIWSRPSVDSTASVQHCQYSIGKMMSAILSSKTIC